MNLNGLSTINLELTTKCNKNCWMCGRRKREHLFKTVYNSNMEFELVVAISEQLKGGFVIHFHNNGEGLLYNKFGKAVSLFRENGCICSLTSNGKLLYEKRDEIYNNLHTISISIIENDKEEEIQLQYNNVIKFLEDKKKRLIDYPNLVLRLVGNPKHIGLYEKLNLIKVSRVLHAPEGSYKYEKNVTIPEIGVCLDLLHHLAIAVNGNVSTCVRFDPNNELVLGNLFFMSLEEVWHGDQRKRMISEHIKGNRKNIKLCNKCEFWGVPTSY